MTYQEIIHELLYNHYLFEPRDNITLKAMELILKKRYPGSYKLEWKNPEHTSEIVLQWDDEQEAMMWYLKWV